MKSFIIFCLAILMMLSSASISGQITTGQVVGFNISNMYINAEGEDVSVENATGIHFGMIFQIPVTDFFNIQPGALFSSKGASYTIDTVRISISPIYIEVPLNAVMHFGSNTFGVVISAGPYVAIGVGGNKIIGGGAAQDITFGSAEGKDLKLFDLGMNFAAGFNIRGFLLSAQYGLGLSNLSPMASVANEMKNRMVGISLISSFNGK